MRPILFSLALLAYLQLGSEAICQDTFQKTFGGSGPDLAYSIDQTSDQGFIIGGYTLGFGAGNRDVYLIRTNASGGTLWSKVYGQSNTDYAWTVQQTTDGGFIVGAHTGSFGAGSHDVYLLKCKADGNLDWTKTYGGSSADGAYSLQQTVDGGFIISSHTSSFGAGQHEVYLIKTNSVGDTSWTRSYGGTSGDFLRSVHQTFDGGYISVSESFSFGVGGADVYLVRTDSIGNLLWAKAYGGSGADYGYSVRETSDSGIIVAGYTSSFGEGSFDVYLFKTDKDGNILWTKTFGGTSSDYGHSIKETDDLGFIIAGYTNSFGIGSDVYLIRTDASGNHLWSKSYGGSGNDVGWSVQQTLDGGFAIGGHTTSFGAGNEDVYLIKTDQSGNSGCHESTPGTIVNDAVTAVSATQTTVSSGASTGVTAPVIGNAATVESVLCEADSTLSCCIGFTGNIDNDPADIADLTFLIDHLFINFPPLVCAEEGNVDGDQQGVVDIADLTFLIDHLFLNFPPTADCAGTVPGGATYIVTFESTWSPSTQPVSFPSNSHYSGLIGATHNASANFWTPGQLASVGIKDMAELGSKTNLSIEVQIATMAGNAEMLLSGGGISPSPGSVNLTFDITSDFPLVSLVAMIAPSPDWFIGVHDFPLFVSGSWLDSVVVTLFAYDAGTDDGTIYTSSDAVTTPPELISQMMESPFLVNSTIPQMGTYTFIRQ